MDVHKESIDIALAEADAGEVRHYGRIGGDLAAVARVVRKLVACGKQLIFVYEAGPCGFVLYRWLKQALPCAGEYVGLEEIDDGVWNVYFGPLKLGRLLERPHANRRCVREIKATQCVTYVPDCSCADLL